MANREELASERNVERDLAARDRSNLGQRVGVAQCQLQTRNHPADLQALVARGTRPPCPLRAGVGGGEWEENVDSHVSQAIEQMLGVKARGHDA